MLTLSSIVRVLILSYTLSVLILLGAFWLHDSRYSFIYSINTTSYDSKKIKKVLDDFSNLEDNSIVKYKGFRPIFITDSDSSLKPEELGVALNIGYLCVITLKKNLPDVFIKYVVLHEYLHCMGFGHSQVATDLMSSYLSLAVSEQNIKEYAHKLKQKMYGK